MTWRNKRQRQNQHPQKNMHQSLWFQAVDLPRRRSWSALHCDVDNSTSIWLTATISSTNVHHTHNETKQTSCQILQETGHAQRECVRYSSPTRPTITRHWWFKSIKCTVRQLILCQRASDFVESSSASWSTLDTSNTANTEPFKQESIHSSTQHNETKRFERWQASNNIRLSLG